MCELREELQRKEQRWTASTQRLRERTEQLEQENKELKEELRILERKRMESLQKEVVSSLQIADSIFILIVLF